MIGEFVGFFFEGLPPYLLTWGAEVLPSPNVAIETGTFRGDTTEVLARTFDSCVTIERSQAFAKAVREKFSNNSRVTILEGSSRDQLANAIPSEDISCFFWLDAHGVYDFQEPNAEENPLLSEIEVILGARKVANTIIAIDDARGMGTQPGWPSLSEITDPLTKAGFTTIYLDDVFLAVPEKLKPDLWNLYQKSRMVEVSAVFHIWPRVIRAARIQATLNKLVSWRP